MKTLTPEQFLKDLKVLRLKKGLSQKQASEKSGMATYQEYAKIENGRTVPGTEKLEHIAQALGYKLEFRRLKHKWLEKRNEALQAEPLEYED